jgi:MoaA/NifB/PqqE/SkfB family radical SAM enzyme
VGNFDAGTLAAESRPVTAMKEIIFGIRYVINHRAFKKSTPLIAGLTVTNACNLRCRHCRIVEREAGDMSYEETTAALDAFYEEGGRTVYIQGGEPFLWRHGRHTIEDIVRYAHGKGYLAVIIYTNGTLPVETTADTVFVSVDGLQKTHDDLRGETFETIMGNIRKSQHPSLFVNFTINNSNKNEIAEFCRHIEKTGRIRGTFFYFHTPYYGVDDLYVQPTEREEILGRVLALKRKHKILNSKAGLNAAIRNRWRRPLDICRVYEKGKVFTCCRYPGDPDLCRNCGYLSYAEIDQTLKLKPSAIFNALKYF